MGLQRGFRSSAAADTETLLSYLHVLVEEQDEDEAEDACHRYGANQQRGEQIVGNGSLWGGEVGERGWGAWTGKEGLSISVSFHRLSMLTLRLTLQRGITVSQRGLSHTEAHFGQTEAN